MTTTTDPRAKTIEQARALAAAVRAFRVLEPEAGWFERWLIRILRASYQQRLRHLVAVLPGDVAEEILRGEITT